MATGTRKLITKEIQQDADTYVGAQGEIWYQEGTTTLRVGDGESPGGTPLSGGSTGDVTFLGVQVIGGGTGSGDGLGNGTLELVPDEDLYSNNQYLIVDPTVPSHIHLRAGGTQDNSSATLILGGEKNNVVVQDNVGVRLNHERTVDTDTNFYDNTQYTNATWFTNAGVNYFRFDTTDVEMINQFWQLTNNTDLNKIYLYDDQAVEYILSPLPWSGAQGDTYTLQVAETPDPGITTITQVMFRLFTTRSSFMSLESDDFRVEVSDDIRMYANDVFRLYNYSTVSGIQLYTDYDGASHRWEFRADGMMEFPSSGVFKVNNSVPMSSLGSSMDKQGMVAFDATHMYYCTADYTDGLTNIWKRIAWSGDTW